MSSTPVDLEYVYQKWMEASAQDFENYQFPVEQLSRKLFNKIIDEVFDSGDYFAIDIQPDPTLIFIDKKKEGVLKCASEVFITDHCWLPEPANMMSEWKQAPALRERLAEYLEYASPATESLSLEERIQNCDGSILELDDLQIESVSDLPIPLTIHTLSLWGTSISSIDDLFTAISKLPNLKALYLNDTLLDTPEVTQHIVNTYKNIEILNSNLTENYTIWAICKLAKNPNPDTITTLDLSDRNLTELKPSVFQLLKNLATLDITSNPLPEGIDLKKLLPSLTSVKSDDRSHSNFVFVNGVDPETNDVAFSFTERLWDHIQPVGERWGLGDEVALAIHPSFTPNVATMPAYNPFNAKSFFVFWPVVDIEPMTEITAYLYPLIPLGAPIPEERREFIPLKSLKSPFKSTVTSKNPIKFYSDIPQLTDNLHNPRFVQVDDKESADLHWLAHKGVEDFSYYYKNKVFVNQIQGETAITLKDRLYETINKYRKVDWLPETYILNVPEEFSKFIKRHKELKESNQSAVWVVKAFNEARASYMVVSDTIGEVLRMAATGSRLAQRYLWNPLTIFEKKFDLRFIVLIKSVKPLEVYLYNTFWLRLAPKKWALEDFDDYERHFTVMNYKSPGKVTHKDMYDFIKQFEIENPGKQWEEVISGIRKVIGELFLLGGQELTVSPYTKGMFGVDIMLTRDYKPVVLECNFSPDCTRACNMCPTFVDDLFEVLFVDQPVTNPRVTFIDIQE